MSDFYLGDCASSIVIESIASNVELVANLHRALIQANSTYYPQRKTRLRPSVADGGGIAASFTVGPTMRQRESSCQSIATCRALSVITWVSNATRQVRKPLLIFLSLRTI